MSLAITARLALFFGSLEQAEQISCLTATAQAALVCDARVQRGLSLQARHEARHAQVFGAAATALSFGTRTASPLGGALQAYAFALQRDLRARNLAGSLIGLQGMLEGLGMVALSPPCTPLARAASCVVPLRAAMLKQEELHHAHGMKVLASALRSDARCARAAVEALDRYGALSAAIVEAGMELFDHYAHDQTVFRRACDDARRHVQRAVHAATC
ncbi:MAG TPA: hypothetical protein VFC24_15050 [Casimicrobiaceae bacterium]|nr:hypothetical protein [Casimicrobiaceae bacterium]